MENTNVVTEEVTEVKVEKPVVETVAVEKKGVHPIQAMKNKKEKFVENHPVAAARIKKGAEITKDVVCFATGAVVAVVAVKALSGNSEDSEAESNETIIDGEYTVTEQEQTETEANASDVVEF